MVLYHVFYRIAFFTAAFIHLWWNDLINAFSTIVGLCLVNLRPHPLQSIFRLHSLILGFFVLGFCFNAVSATQLVLGRESLKFDDIQTPDGFGNMTTPYEGLIFDGFFAFNPSHPSLKGIISLDDLNCAVSKPNALYGTRDNFKSNASQRPSIRICRPSQTFTLHALQLKPLDMPLGFVTVNILGFPKTSGHPLKWSVDFPAGFHDVLDVRLEEFGNWNGLERVEIWADFHYNDVTMDWEFCIDNLDVQIESVSP